MPDNVLRAIIKVDAPGINQTFQNVNLNIQQSIKQLDRLYIALNRATEPAQIKQYEIAISQLEGRIASMQAVSNASSISLGNIGKQAVSAKNFFAAFGVQLSHGYSILRQIAYVIPGIGVGGIVAGAVSLLGTALFGTGEKAAKANDDFKSLAETLGNQSVKLTTLVGIVRNTTSSYDDKKKALQAINQEYGSYLKNIGIEKATEENLVDTYNKVIDALLRQAVIKGLQEQINKAVSDTADKMLKLQIQQEKNNELLQGTNNLTKEEIEINKKKIDSFQKARETLISFNKPVLDGNLAQIQSNQSVKEAIGQSSTYQSRLQALKDQLTVTLAPLFNLTNKFGDLGIKLNDVNSKTQTDIFRQIAENANAAAKAISEIEQRQLRESIDSFGAIAKDENESLSKRTDALYSFYNKSIDLISGKAKAEIDSLNNQEQIEEKEAKTKVNNAIQLEALLTSIHTKYSALRENITSKEADDFNKLGDSFSKTFSSLRPTFDLSLLDGIDKKIQDTKNKLDEIRSLKGKFLDFDFQKTENDLLKQLSLLNQIKAVTEKGQPHPVSILNDEENAKVIEKFKAQFQSLGVIGQQAFDKIFNPQLPASKNQEQLASVLTQLKNIESQAKRTAEQIAQGLGNSIKSFIDAVKSGSNPIQAFFKSIEQAVEDIVVSLIEQAIKQQLINVLNIKGTAVIGAKTAAYIAETAAAKAAAAAEKAAASASGGGGSGGFGLGQIIGLLSLVGFAEGGPVKGQTPIVAGEKGREMFVPSTIIQQFLNNKTASSGNPIMVGERGQQIFIPPQDGFIVPNHKLKHFAGGGNISAGVPAIVGEKGIEIFVPSKSISAKTPIGTVKAGNFDSFSGEVVFRIGNNELIGTLSKGYKNQSRLV